MASSAPVPVSNSMLDLDSASVSNMDINKLLTHEIFSILETKFLFGGFDDPKLPSHLDASTKHLAGKVRILSIDGAGATDGLLAAKSLVHLEASLRKKSGNPNACIAEYFDLAAGTGVGGVLAALLFTRGKDGAPIFTASEALKFLTDNRGRIMQSGPTGLLRRVFRPAKAEKLFRKIFGECTLKDTLKPVLIPCYDLTTRAPFVFSRADAMEIDGYDFKMKDVCAATLADPSVELRSVDGQTKIAAIGGGIVMSNPTAAAITHVLNNKQEFPFCNGVEDLLVVSLGNGESDSGPGSQTTFRTRALIKIAGEGASDTVDQAVSMAFGECRSSNYVRIQANSATGKIHGKKDDQLRAAEEMLGQKSVESVLFQGKRLGQSSHLEKLESVAGEVIKEQEIRKTRILPTVVLKQGSASSPRTSSATSLSTLSSN
ncbi:patatin-like protein 7 [Diospyros lotus]|uniref:patatin-like protein 7 n=1 Tax=Diospyros lotus TaxID=55363 RepID=UPI00224DD434|nr:patatin-like protein 7 [Diospyros lotus]